MNAGRSFIVGGMLASALLGTGAAGAQQITGPPGSPSPTTTIQGDRIPAPPPKFSDTGSPVDDNDYKVRFKFTGTTITLTVDRPKLTPEAEKRLTRSARDKKASN